MIREMWASLCERMSERAFSEAAQVSRTTLRYEAKPASGFDREVREMTVGLAWKWTAAGSPMVTQLLRRLGYLVNHKRVERIWQDEELQVPRKRSMPRAYGTPWQREIAAQAPNEVWCYDFLFERTRLGLELKMLAVVDEYTRECLAVHVDERIDAGGVRAVLAGLMAARGVPRYIRSDNGSEFKAGWLQDWIRAQGATPMYIDPGSPWQNGYAESFNGTFRRECLDREALGSRLELQVVADWWRKYYNEHRPHSGIGYRTPSEAAKASPGRPSRGGDQCSLN